MKVFSKFFQSRAFVFVFALLLVSLPFKTKMKKELNSISLDLTFHENILFRNIEIIRKVFYPQVWKINDGITSIVAFARKNISSGPHHGRPLHPDDQKKNDNESNKKAIKEIRTISRIKNEYLG